MTQMRANAFNGTDNGVRRGQAKAGISAGVSLLPSEEMAPLLRRWAGYRLTSVSDARLTRGGFPGDSVT